MTRFEQKLAAFQRYIANSEPQISPQVDDIIDKYYKTKTGFSGMGDAGYMPTFPIGDGATSVDTPATTAAAVDTSNVLGDFFNTLASGVVNGLNYQANTKNQLAILQAQAQIARAQASGSASTNNTTFLVLGAVGLVAVLALMRRR